MMLLKEQTRNRSKIFHICDSYDIATIRALRDYEEQYANQQQTLPDLKSTPSKIDQIIEEEKTDRKSQIATDDHPLTQKQSTLCKQHSLPGSLQVINFMRTNLSYEFASKYMDATDGVGAVGNAGAKSNQMNPRE